MSHISDSSSPGIKPAAHESTETDNTRIISSDGNNSTILIFSNAHEIAPSTEIKSPPHESTQTDSNQILSSEANINHENASSSEIQPITLEPTPIPVSEANNRNNSSSQWTQSTIHESAQPDSNQILSSEANIKHENASSSEIQPVSLESTPIPVSEANIKHENASSSEIQPVTLESTSIPVSEANNNNNSSSRQTQPESTQTPATDQLATTHIPEKPKEASIEDRKLELKNLIDQELKYIFENAPKLGKHQEYLKNEAKSILTMFKKMQEGDCGLKELKDVKKTVTKLKLQIPARYRMSAESSQHKNQQYGASAKSKGFHNKLPQFCYNSVFEQSPMCKLIQERYEKLSTIELKLCLLSFSVFPENAIISRRLMVYWWIAEGFVPSSPEPRIEEELANQYFNELLEKDFIEPVNRKPACNVATCKMHPLIRSAVVTLASKMKFFDFDEDGKTKDFSKHDEIGGPEEISDADAKEFFDFFEPNGTPIETVDFEDENGLPTQFVDMDQIGASPIVEDDRGQRVTNPIGKVQKEGTVHHIDHNGKEIENKYYLYRKKKIFTNSYRVCLVGNGLPKGLEWENIHILFNVEDDILEVKPEWFMRLKNVNVVFLGRWQSSATHHIEVEDLKFLENLQNMKHLRFFSLQGVSRISKLPDSILHLKNLIILDLRACHNLEKIPKGIGSLALLTHLDMSECYLLDHMPKEISSLLELQVLKGFVVGDSPGKHSCTLDDLAKLPKLRKFSMYTRMKEFPEDTHLDALQKFKVLSKLTIAWGGHTSEDESKELKHDDGGRKNDNISSRLRKWLSRQQHVQGRLKRQNAFRTVTLGSKLEKLDLKCYPKSITPIWLRAENLQKLKKLYIRGGQFSDLGQFQGFADLDNDTNEWANKQKCNWSEVEVLRLKYLDQLEMDWRELQELFPKLMYIEKVKCPKLTLFPCDESGVWMKKASS